MDRIKRRVKAGWHPRLYPDAEQARGIECDLTSRAAEDRYYIVTGTGFATHDFAWIKANIPGGLDVRLRDVTSAYAVLSLMGPRSREVLDACRRRRCFQRRVPFGRCAKS